MIDPVTRWATPADFPEIDAFDPFAGDRAEEIAQGRCVVAVDSGRVVGYASFSRVGFIGRPFLHFLCVAEGHRRRGLVVRLARAVERVVGAARLFASTEAANIPMHAFFEREGQTAAGRVVGVNEDGADELFHFKDITRSAGSVT